MLTVQGPFPPRKASAGLRDQLVRYLQDGHSSVGAPFYSDANLMEISGLSRRTVRRALDDLHRTGWIVRQPGRGSFVGPRAALRAESFVKPSPRRKVVRLAVMLMYGTSGGVPDWYSQEVLAGLDEAAVEQGISIELMGCQPDDFKTLGRRLTQSGPDVLAIMAAGVKHAFAVAEADRFNIPCLLTGTRLLDLNKPTVCEDGVQGAAMAVQHLIDQGHNRIALIQRVAAAPWPFHRRQGYLQGLADAGLPADERLVLWLDAEDDIDLDRSARRLDAFLQEQRPTALLLASNSQAWALGQLVRTGKYRVPEDLSVVTFDQAYFAYLQELGVKPTVVALPLRAMGRRLAEMARATADGAGLPQRTFLPCTLTEGSSVAPPSR